MNFNLSEEQTMIQNSVARFVQDNNSCSRRGTRSSSPVGRSRSSMVSRTFSPRG